MLYDGCRTIHRLVLAGVFVDLKLRFSSTVDYLHRYVISNECSWEMADFPPVEVTDRAFLDWEKAGNAIDDFAEFCLLCQPVSERLFYGDRCVFHAAALRYQDKAFLIAGRSGLGKSTHCTKLLTEHKEDFSVINGDKPILQYNNGRAIVHPSPWNGKEGLKGASAAELAGIFLLKRAEDNSITACDEKKAAVLTFPFIFQSFDNEDVIRKAALITEKIIRSTSVFTFNSKDIEESSELLYQTIKTIKETRSDDL